MSGAAQDLLVLTLALRDEREDVADVVTSELGWRRVAHPQDGTTLAVQPSAPSGTSAPGLLRQVAVRRLHARAREQPARDLHRAVFRLPARRMRDGWSARARSVLADGTVVRLSRHSVEETVLGAVLRQSGCAPVCTVVGVSGGVLLVRASRPDGQVLLRVAPADAPGDPRRVAEVLTLLERQGIPLVPRLVSVGVLHALSWTAETLLPGRRPPRLTDALVGDVLGFLAALPGLGVAAAERPLTTVLARLLPQWADASARLEDWVAVSTRELPSVLRHGDLWSGNLLTQQGRLSGLVDWDACTEAGLPGVDLMHLLATDQRLASRRSTGDLLLSEPWRRAPFGPALDEYWRARSLGSIDDDTASAVTAAWWTGHTAADLQRRPWLVQDDAWVNSTLRLVLPRWQG